MASYEFKNNARSTVADNPLAAGATTLNVATGEGANFPSSFPFKLTLSDPATYPDPGMEITKCTGRTADALTIVRGQEGTADVAHSNGERVAMLFTAGHFNDPTTGIVTKLDTIETDAKDDQTASEVPIVDSGSIITATDVEDALQENRTAIDLNTSKDTNTVTNLSEGTSTETTVDVDSSDGTNATLVAASTIRAGLLTKAKFDEIIANTSKNTNVTTDLSEGTNTETTVDVNSSDGTNATLVSASTLRAGLLTKAKFDEIVANNAKVTNATHTGDVTGSGELTITDDAVTYGKMQNIVNDERIWGRVSGADGIVEELTKAQVLSMLSVEDGADVTDTANVTSAGAFMDSEFPDQSFQNILKNGDFVSWSAGTSAVPAGWNGVSTPWARESTIKKLGSYSAKLTCEVGVNAYLSQSVGNLNYYKGRTLTLQAWVHASNANRIRIYIYDEVDTTWSPYHSGGGGWELLTVSHTVNASATNIFARLIVHSGNVISGYFDGAILVEGSVCPTFSPYPTDQIPIVLTSAPTDAGTNGETRWYAIAGAGGARRLYMSNGTDWKYIAIAT